MARYEVGAIYKIDGKDITYYVRLLTGDVYGVFEPIDGEICEETFEHTGYRLYISTGSFAVKRGFWEKVVPSPDKKDTKRWRRPPHLVHLRLGILKRHLIGVIHLMKMEILKS